LGINSLNRLRLPLCGKHISLITAQLLVREMFSKMWKTHCTLKTQMKIHHHGLLCHGHHQSTIPPYQNTNYPYYFHVSVSDLLYIFPGSICLFCCRKYVDRSWESINRAQTHECGNWDCGRAIPRIGKHKWDFRCSA
jgi:hypothetical protein